MTASKTLTTAVATATIVGAISFAYAQTTDSSSTPTQGAPAAEQKQNPTAPSATTTDPSTTTQSSSPSMSSTPSSSSTAPSGSSTATPSSTDSSSAPSSEPAPKADRN